MPTDVPRRRGWYLYLLMCSDGTLYTGITNDLQRRLNRHSDGTASRYTRSRLPVILVYREGCRGKSSALKKEYRIKSLTRRAKEEYIAKKSRSALLRGARQPCCRLKGAEETPKRKKE